MCDKIVANQTKTIKNGHSEGRARALKHASEILRNESFNQEKRV